MTYSTPPKIQKFLSTVKVGDCFIAVYDKTTRLRLVTAVSKSAIIGISPIDLITFSTLFSGSKYATKAHTIISVSSLAEAQSLYPELFI